MREFLVTIMLLIGKTWGQKTWGQTGRSPISIRPLIICCEKSTTIPGESRGDCHASVSSYNAAYGCDVLGARNRCRGTRLLWYLGSQRRKEHAPQGQHDEVPDNRH